MLKMCALGAFEKLLTSRCSFALAGHEMRHELGGVAGCARANGDKLFIGGAMNDL